MDTIITRFPPSPTGYLHIGGARTALFNWLYARKTNGRFVLRIEDTDEARSTQASVDAIFESLEWLGINWDEGPYFQTQRYDIYRQYIRQLVDSGHAYHCSCTPEQVEAMREEARAAGKKPMYNGKCRELGLTGGPGTVVRLKTPLMGTTVVDDVVKGATAFQNAEMDDFIIQRSDGSPTYNLAVVVDDITMGINTIIRGDDHLINTPKQILLYKAFGAPLPLFAHVPMVLGSDKARLSKRHGAMSVGEYKTMGFLPDAMLNYLVRLGWSFGDQEFFTREDLVDKFSLENIGKSPSMFDMDKLSHLNAKHIQAKTPAELIPHLMEFLRDRGVEPKDMDQLKLVIATLQPRSRTLVEMADSALFYFRDKLVYDPAATAKFLVPDTLSLLKQLRALMAALTVFDEPSLESCFKTVMETTGLKFGKIAQPVRVALTGTTVSPGIFEMILALGRDSTLGRIDAAIALIESGPA
ncbi:MAG: glutamate--tRNA ligase [Pseudomonadota bacterium]